MRESGRHSAPEGPSQLEDTAPYGSQPTAMQGSAGREDAGACRSSKQGNDEEATPRRRSPRAGEEGGGVHPTEEKLAAPWGSQAAVSSALGVLPHTLLSPLAPSSRQPPGSSRRLTAFSSLMSPPGAQRGLGPGWQDTVHGADTGSISPELPGPP